MKIMKNVSIFLYKHKKFNIKKIFLINYIKPTHKFKKILKNTKAMLLIKLKNKDKNNNKV